VGIRTETILSGWSGGGGLDLGVRLALRDSRVVCYLEREATCVALLVERMAQGWLDDAPVWSDSRTFDGLPWRGRVSGFIGGPPCQPFSFAGKRGEDADERNCWPDALRITADVRPDWVFFENVPGSAGYVGRRVVPRLEEMGYRVAAGIFSAEEVGAPHLRERLFVLGVAGGARWPPAWAGPGEHAAPEPEPGGGTVANAGSAQLSWAGRSEKGRGGAAPAGAGVGDAERPGREGRVPGLSAGAEGRQDAGRAPAGPGLPLFPPYRSGDGARWAAVLERCPGLAPAVEPGVCGVADGLAGLSRAQWLRVLGNGVVPLVAGHALRTLGQRL